MAVEKSGGVGVFQDDRTIGWSESNNKTWRVVGTLRKSAKQ